MNNSVFEQHSLPRTYIKFAMPVIFSLIITVIYNIADTYFIARTGNLNLVAGVSLCAPVFTILMAIGNTLAQGGSSLMARLLGAGDMEKTAKVTSYCFYMSLLLGLVLGVAMLLFLNPFLALLGASSNTIGYAAEYCRILAIGAPFIALSFIHSNLLRSEGFSTLSMIGTVSGSVVNIILDPLLIFTFNMGAAGAAIATVLGYLFSDLVFIVMVLKKSQCISINPKKMHVSTAEIKQIYGIGIPAALTNIMSSLCVIVTNQFLLSYGDHLIAAMGIVQKVSMIGMLILTGFSFGGAPLAGYFYGSRNKAKLEELFRFCYRSILALAVVLLAVLMLSAKPLLNAFVTDSELLTETIHMFRFQVICLPFMALTLMSTIFTQAFGKVKGSFILSLSRQGFVFLIVLPIMAALLGYNGIVMGQFAADIVSSLISAVVILKIIRPEIQNLA